jgi:hypothetical protein
MIWGQRHELFVRALNLISDGGFRRKMLVIITSSFGLRSIRTSISLLYKGMCDIAWSCDQPKLILPRFRPPNKREEKK